MSKIEWTEATWNPVVGCSVVSPGCTNCYAMRMAARLEAMAIADKSRWTEPRGGLERLSHYVGTTQPSKAGPVWTGKISLAPERILTEPLRRRKPTTYFVNSMSDLFHEDVPDGWIMYVLNVIWQTPQHTYQVLTKRSDRMREFMRQWNDLSGEDFEPKLVRGPDETRRAHPSGRGQLFAAYLDTLLELSGGKVPDGASWPTFDWAGGMIGWPSYPANLWLGVSCERQQEADARIPDLLATPAAVRFVSAEPLLGPIDFTANKLWHGPCAACQVENSAHPGSCTAGKVGLDWIIVGGESGANARPMHPDWARSIRDQCVATGVPFFFKQWGEYREFDTGSPEVETVCNDSDDANAIAACAVRPSWLSHDGQHYTSRKRLPEGLPCRLIEHVGKQAAGRLLDGRTWDQMPGATTSPAAPTATEAV